MFKMNGNNMNGNKAKLENSTMYSLGEQNGFGYDWSDNGFVQAKYNRYYV